MTTAKELGLQWLHRRAAMLVKLLNLKAPEKVIALQVAIVLDAAMLAYGDVVPTMIGKLQRERLLNSEGYCRFCEKPLGKNPYMCETCMAEAQKIDDEAGAALALSELPEDGPTQ